MIQNNYNNAQFSCIVTSDCRNPSFWVNGVAYDGCSESHQCLSYLDTDLDGKVCVCVWGGGGGLQIPARTEPNLAEHRHRRQQQAIILMGGLRSTVGAREPKRVMPGDGTRKHGSLVCSCVRLWS